MHEGYAVTRDRWTTSFSASHLPALEVDPPAVIAFEASDAAVARLLAGVPLEEIGFANLNPVTGPVIVSGSEPGDALAIEVLEITVERAWTGWFPDVGSLGGRTDRVHVREVPIRDARVWVTDAIGVPLRPMIGCAGLAPAEGESATVVPAYPWGARTTQRRLSRRMLMVLSNPTRATQMFDVMEQVFANGAPDPETAGPLRAQLDMEMLEPPAS